ncbi:YrrS family protein [Fictibacillus phosphorivorans]|uniref:YrrS family protein n=1 Tax=Fictibacillus phosphorivorans TaxID=1221500 RepID=UPI002040D076|nr:YrrS family protein [Fictibacillus phosphorivorans]MCM3716953.1 YrrS family protein [Fictibacillus phosphorivorans]MCM3774498.1 YrrS family protein [Fictibacillus phosphorivorans]
MKRNQRYESRLEKRKQNRFLNIAIGLVFLLIVVVAFNLFSGDDNKTASTSDSEQTESNQGTKEEDSSIEMESDKGDQNSSSDESENQKEDTETNTEETPPDSETPEGGGPEGPWSPIGTSQTEPHQKSYDSQSQDWKEMVQALSYATNIPEDQMTIFWLGNGGGPDLSKGTVQSKTEKVKYDVVLQWIPEKGWQPTSVTQVQ